MNEKIKGSLITAGVVAALAAGGAAIAGASGDDAGSASPTAGPDAVAAEDGGAKDDEAGRDDGNGQPVTGTSLDRASKVALDAAGGGTVTGSEIRDEEGYYEIEVTQADGSQLDVHLDADFGVLDSESDGADED